MLEHILDIAYDMLVSGSEVGRAERQIEKMCRAYGMEEVEVFIITSSIVVSARGRDGVIRTQTKRIRRYRTNFYKIELIEKLIEKICREGLTEEQIGKRRKEIEELCRQEQLNKIQEYAVFCFVSMIFTLFFGGTAGDGAAAFLCGIFIRMVLNFLEPAVTNRFVINVMASMTGGFAAWSLFQIGLADSVDKVIIGNIMLLIPGLATVNALKDLISGEMITGLLRLADAVVQAVAIAIGFAVVLLR